VSRLPEVLIVDDRRENLFALEQLLRKLDCRVRQAQSGDGALALTLEHDFALAIVDVQMPGMDGYELVEYLRANPSTSQVPVIFVSAAYADEHHLFKGYETGAVDYIVKPFEPAVLLGKVRVFLELAHYRHNLESIIQERTRTISETSQLQKSVAEFSAALLNLSHKGDFDRDVEKALGRVALALGADRVYTLLAGSDPTMAMCHEWCANGVEERRSGFPDLQAERFPWLSQQIASPHCVTINAHDSWSDAALAEYRLFGSAGAQSTLLVPLRSIGGRSGLIVFEALAQQRQWSPSVNELLMLLGNAFIGALNRQQTMNALRSSEARFRDVATMNWVWETDAAGCYIHSSEKVEGLLGYPAADMIGRNHLEFIVPADQAQFQADLQRQLDASAPVIEIECNKTTRDGRSRCMQSSCIALRDRDGKLTGLRGTDKDITERRSAEESLTQFKTIFDTASFGAAIGCIDGTITYCNACFAEMHGHEVSELLGMPMGRLLIAAEAEDWDPLLREVLDQGGIAAREMSHQRGDGSQFPVLGVFTLVRDSHGQPSGIATTAIDLTERKALQSQLQQAQRMESIGRLAGGVAHDFNNMLGVILGQLEIAEKRLEGGKPLDHCFSEIRTAAEHSVSLTRQLLAFARIQTVAPEIIDIDEVMGSMHRLLQRLIGENIELEWRPGKGIWPVHMDPVQFDQILVNLCLNARDAITDLGRIRIETENIVLSESHCAGHADCKAGDHVKISVYDNGCGMDPETLQHVFEPFFSTKGNGLNSGLGLATVYGAVRQNGGLIEITSRTGEGTHCAIYLPRAVSPARFATPRGRSGDDKQLPRGSETVLVVEDSEAYLQTIAEKLRSLGYRVLTANSAEQASDRALTHEGRIDLLLTDVVMPDSNGKELATRMRDAFPDMACLYMSGYPNDIIAHHGVVESGLQLLQKPTSTQALATGVRKALGDWQGLAHIDDALLAGDAPVSEDALPGDCIQGLQTALDAGDMVQFKEGLLPVRTQAPATVDHLIKLADRYDYEQIDEYLKSLGDQR
jgi:two-component system cell cycle sensor histidine kinase/response regulator CckA